MEKWQNHCKFDPFAVLGINSIQQECINEAFTSLRIPIFDDASIDSGKYYCNRRTVFSGVSSREKKNSSYEKFLFSVFK